MTGTFKLLWSDVKILHKLTVMVTWQASTTTAISCDLIWINMKLTETLEFPTPEHNMNSNLVYRLQVKDVVVKTRDYQEENM